jgi:hypothetical protein
MSGGSPEIGVAVCYEGIYRRDHVRDIAELPWWAWRDGDLETRRKVYRQFVEKHDADWFILQDGPTRYEQENVRVEKRGRQFFLVDRSTKKEEEIFPPVSGGSTVFHAEHQARDRESFDRLIGADPSPETPFENGAADFAAWQRKTFPDRYLLHHVSSPLWWMFACFSFDLALTLPIEDPDLVRYATRRLMKRVKDVLPAVARRGADGIWIEECYTDMLSPKVFAEFNVPLVQELVEAIHASGMQAVYYYCGSPHDRWDLIKSTGADGFHFEEGKKGFVLDIAEASRRIGPKAGLFGNVDAYHILEKATDADLRNELRRQVEVGRQREGRFVVSTGSPVTPDTPVQRVRRYYELVHELARAGR